MPPGPDQQPPGRPGGISVFLGQHARSKAALFCAGPNPGSPPPGCSPARRRGVDFSFAGGGLASTFHIPAKLPDKSPLQKTTTPWMDRPAAANRVGVAAGSRGSTHRPRPPGHVSIVGRSLFFPNKNQWHNPLARNAVPARHGGMARQRVPTGESAEIRTHIDVQAETRSPGITVPSDGRVLANALVQKAATADALPAPAPAFHRPAPTALPARRRARTCF